MRSPNEKGYQQYTLQNSAFTQRIDRSPSRMVSGTRTGPSTQALGIDRESIVEHYRNLRQKEKDILSRVNMSEDLKRETLGFPDSYYCTNPIAKVPLVSVIHPFKGRLVVTEEKWK